jgi:hypothetical protein
MVLFNFFYCNVTGYKDRYCISNKKVKNVSRKQENIHKKARKKYRYMHNFIHMLLKNLTVTFYCIPVLYNLTISRAFGSKSVHIFFFKTIFTSCLSPFLDTVLYNLTISRAFGSKSVQNFFQNHLNFMSITLFGS